MEVAQNTKKTWKRDALVAEEEAVHQFWEIHNCDTAPPVTEVTESHKDKYFATFPYPYMNGFLHLGHGFTMSKYDFMCRYYRMIGRNVLEPFSFHLTGMPIVAASKKLERNLENGQTGDGTQYASMHKMGIAEQDIPKFVDPMYWGKYFPPHAIKTLKRLGIGFDPERSFITTDANPHYDRFVKWQFQSLYQKGVLKFGDRYTIYSPTDKQPCLGHDRSSGENAKPNKFSLIRLKLVGEPGTYLMALTMRPETLYGMTNVWVDPDGTYTLFQLDYGGDKKETWIMQPYNLANLQHQRGPIESVYQSAVAIGTVMGKELLDKEVEFPHSYQKKIPVWALDYGNQNPLLKVDMSKGTGIVASVPSDSPIDYMGYLLHHAKNGKITTEQVEGAVFAPIIQVNREDTYQGCMLAPDIVQKLGKTKNGTFSIDQKGLAIAKEICYAKTTNFSVMMVGDYGGQSIVDVRTRLENDWKESLVSYYEPDELAISRTGERLVVALADQWFIDYGNPDWKKRAISHVESMEFHDPIVRQSMLDAMNWIEEWPFSRNFGLGTRVRLDTDKEELLVDSLSDSTIYMALYTVYHRLKQIDPEKLTPEVFDYIFLLKGSDEEFGEYKGLQKEFMYWYPVDLRVSARDLVTNHLVMNILNHVMIWDDEFLVRARDKGYLDDTIKSFGPRSYKINGYIMVNKPGEKPGEEEAEKMSKSTGNFKTLDQALDIYSADSIRFLFASAGDSSCDAYFDQDQTTKIVEKLYKEKVWFEELLAEIVDGKYLDGEMTDLDRIFHNEILDLISRTRQAYETMQFRDVMKYGFHGMQSLRDWYREITKGAYNLNCIRFFIRAQIALIYPIMPHFSQMIHNNPNYQKTYEVETEVQFPIGDILHQTPVDWKLRWEHHYVSDIASKISSRVTESAKKKKPVKEVTIHVVDGAHNNIETEIWKILDADNPIPKDQIWDKLPPGTDKKQGGRIMQNYIFLQSRMEQFGPEWYANAKNGTLDELITLKKYIRSYLPQTMNTPIVIMGYDPAEQMEVFTSSPAIRIVTN